MTARGVSGRSADRAALAAARRVLRGRAGLPSRADLAYGVYLAVLLIIIVVAPVMRAGILGLVEGLRDEVSPELIAAIVAGAAALISLAALTGAQTGPAHARLPEVDLLHTSALPRGRLLARPLARSFLAAGAAGALLAGVLAAALALRGGLGSDARSAFAAASALLGGGAGIGLLAAAAMLLGQLGRGARRTVAGASGLLAAALCLLAAVPDPAPREWLFSSAWSIPVLLLVPLALGVAGALCSPPLAARLQGETLREQSVRLGAVGGLALTGELRAAANRLGAPVRTGRGWRWRVPRRIAAAVLVRDLVGLARTPARSLAALAGAVAAGALLGSALFAGAGFGAADSVGVDWGAAAIVGASATLLAYAAIGPWCRGLRAAAETVGGFALTPSPPAALLLRHVVVPGALAVVSLGGAAGIASSSAPLLAASAGTVTALVALLLRLAGALKGPLPQSLLAPVPTPVGDMSGANVALWSIDGVVAAVLIGGLLAAIASASALGGLLAAPAVLALLGAWAGLRLRRASGG